MINSKLLSFVFIHLFPVCVLIQKNWTATQFLHDAFEKIIIRKKKSLDTIVTDVLIWNQVAA